MYISQLRCDCRALAREGQRKIDTMDDMLFWPSATHRNQRSTESIRGAVRGVPAAEGTSSERSPSTTPPVISKLPLGTLVTAAAFYSAQSAGSNAPSGTTPCRSSSPPLTG